jgi:hypothetical protein
MTAAKSSSPKIRVKLFNPDLEEEEKDDKLRSQVIVKLEYSGAYSVKLFCSSNCCIIVKSECLPLLFGSTLE